MLKRCIPYLLLALIFSCAPKETVKKDDEGKKPEIEHSECKKSFNIGYEYYKLKMYGDAIRNFEEALECSTTYVDSYLMLGKAYIETQQYGLSEETYNRLIENVPGTILGYTGLAWLYVKMKRYGEAIGAYEKAITIDSTDATIYHGLGFVYEEMKDFFKAESLYEKAYAKDPKSQAIAYALGKVYLENKKSNEAVTLLEKLAAEFPEDREVALSLGDAHFDCKNYSKALDKYLLIKSDLSEFATIYIKIGKCYEELRQYSNAAANFDTAIEKSDNKIIPYYHVINMYLVKIKNYGKAQSYITRAFSVAPGDAGLNCMNGDVYLGYGDGARTSKKYKTAISHYETGRAWYGKATGNPQWGTYANNGIKRANAKIKNTQQQLWYGDE
jgi:tetratricopeptide (TPR) repeat protein